MTTDTSDAALLSQMYGMGEADLSVLRAALQQPVSRPTAQARGFGRKADDAVLGTQSGSENDRLWHEFEARGWMSKEQFRGEFGNLSTQMGGVFYKLLPHGREPISALLDQRDARKRQSSSLIDIRRDRCIPFVDELIASVKSSGGNAPEIAILLASTLNAAVARIAVPGREEFVLDDVVAKAKTMLQHERTMAD